MTKENSKSILKILALFLTLLALLSTLFSPLLSDLQANASSYTLTDSLVQNESGSWVSSGGKWLDRWLNYNCYAFAVERFEYPKKYTSRFQYQPGDFSHNTGLNITRKSAEYIANAVKDDLVAIGHEESSISISTAIPTVNSNQQLICIRTTSSNAFIWDYHFMRFDSDTNAWYHKPGPTAILKYKYTPTNDRHWKAEAFDENGVQSSNLTYTSTIYFIKYNKNIFDPTRESSTISKNIPAGKDTMIEMNCSTSTTGHFVLTANNSVKATLYNDQMDPLISVYGTTINELRTLTAGKYYLQVMFLSTSDSGSIQSSFYTHLSGAHCIICDHGVGGQHTYDDSYMWKNDRQHLAKCSCGLTKMNGHAVRAGSFVGGYATCIQCGGRASIGFVVPGSFSTTTLPCSANGSYILPNGVIVLVEADVASFLQGTLVFTQGTLLNIAA